MACIFVLFVTSFLVPFLSEVALHGRVVASYIEECRREYEREGVLVEAVTLLEEKGKGFTEEDIPSVFAPSYTFTISSDTITVKPKRGTTVVLQARIRWEGDRVVVVAAENEFIRPFLK